MEGTGCACRGSKFTTGSSNDSMEPALNLLHGLKGTGSSPIVTINVKMINGINVVQCIYPECR